MQQLSNTVRVTRKTPGALELPVVDPHELPPQVGNSWTDPLFRGAHAKSQRLFSESQGKFKAPQYSGGTRPDNLPQLKTATAEELMALLSRSNPSNRSLGGADATNPYQKQEMVLNFFAYFVETVPESVEKVRIRRVTISFFPEDSSIRIQEPVIPNSGLRGGTLLQRGQVPATSRQREVLPNEPVVNLCHLYVGAVVCIYAVDYHLYDCEGFTRRVLEANGYNVAPPMNVPNDAPSATAVPHPAAPVAPRRVGDGAVLNFSAYFDDREAPGGAVRLFHVNVFADDATVAITERPTGAERTPSAFLSRRRLPRRAASKAVELTFSARVNGQPEADIGPDGYYALEDFYIGQHLHVYGRVLHLYDCDGFTRDYCKTHMGIEQGAAVDISPLLPSEAAAPPPPPPPPTGYGTEEDSLVSCKSLVLRAPKRRHPKGNRILRFEMRLHNPSPPEERMRRFVLVYYDSTEEGMIHEMPIRNTGYVGGKFMARQRLKKTDKEFFNADDFRVGQTITLNGFKFDIVDSDEHTKKMLNRSFFAGHVPEERVRELLKALYQYCICRYFTATEAFLALDRDKDGLLSAAEIVSVLSSIEVTSTDDEGHAIFDALDGGEKGFVSFEDILRFITHGTDAAVNLPQTAEHREDHSRRAAQKRLRASVLRRLHAVLEGRCIDGFEMFRLLSTMPRAYKGARSVDLMSLTNATRDCYVTPVQLRRGVNEILGLALLEAEMAALTEFFFGGGREAVDLTTFHRLICEMDALCQLK